MKNPLKKVIAEYPDDKIEFVWKNRGQLTHLVVNGKRLKFSGMSRSLFAILQDEDASFDEELIRLLRTMVDGLKKV